MQGYEVSLHVTRVKPEHAAYVVRALEHLGAFLMLDGTDLGLDLTVEGVLDNGERDGVEHVHTFLFDRERQMREFSETSSATD